ncbi:histidine kinase dimerization/phosphoacceptor domain -containing protein [Larkinella sp. VNQ87]|uniref:histidine kinase dimerization/phosphoacceptor domain -containing protein n=1 Tax=Larkinella sp. VNQ87 TaxID=3400921 RepID=UPI003BFDF040
MHHLFRFLFFVGVLLTPLAGVLAQPQAHSIDSLKVLLKQSRPDTNRAKLLLELARSYIMKPGERAADLDTALLLVRQGYSISRYFHFTKGEGNAYLIGAQAYREKGEVQQARRFGQTAINRFVKNHHSAELAAAYMEMGNTFGNSNEELRQKVKQYESALRLFQQVGNLERQAVTLKELGDFYQLLWEHARALALLKQALTIYQKIGHKDLQGLYDLLGHVSTEVNDFKAAISYGLLAVKTAELRKDTTLQLCTIYNRLGRTHYYIKEYETAITYYKKSLPIALRHNDVNAIWTVGLNLAGAYFRTNQYQNSLDLLVDLSNRYPHTDLYNRVRAASYFIENYRMLRQYAQAKKYCNQFQQLITEQNKKEEPNLPFLYPGAIHFYIDTRQFHQVRPLITEYNEWAKQSGVKELIALSHYYWFKLDSAQSDYRSAIVHFRRYTAFKDSVLTETKNKEIAKIQIAYETEKKDKRLKVNEKNIQLLTSKNAAQQATQNFAITGAVLLMLLLGLTYNRYRLKQRTNRQLEAKQRLIDQKNQSLQQVLSEKEQLLEEREWMLKEIHHRVKNNLQVISSMLNSQFDFLNDPTALSAIRESQNRVQVMALIHQKLYMSDNLGQINMNEYVHEIVDYLIESFDRFQTIHPQITVPDVHFDVSLATPLGLIINEAVTNSLKYAFPENRPGTVAVRLSCGEEQRYQLIISDDGVGLPAGFDATRSNTLGLTMIRGLSKQIRGTLDITQCNGLEISLQFNTAAKTARTVLQSAKNAD